MILIYKTTIPYINSSHYSNYSNVALGFFLFYHIWRNEMRAIDFQVYLQLTMII